MAVQTNMNRALCFTHYLATALYRNLTACLLSVTLTALVLASKKGKHPPYFSNNPSLGCIRAIDFPVIT